MTNRKDGGAAFPFQEQAGAVQPEYGMTLRDWFAGMALQGELSSQSTEIGEWGESSFGNLAARLYKIADAMLAEREKAGSHE